MKKKLPKQMIETEPDIAFWFDGTGRYLVKVKDPIAYQDLVLACMDLLAKAVGKNSDIDMASWTEEG